MHPPMFDMAPESHLYAPFSRKVVHGRHIAFTSVKKLAVCGIIVVGIRRMMSGSKMFLVFSHIIAFDEIPTF